MGVGLGVGVGVGVGLGLGLGLAACRLVGDSSRAVCPRRRRTRVGGCDVAPGRSKWAEWLQSDSAESPRSGRSRAATGSAFGAAISRRQATLAVTRSPPGATILHSAWHDSPSLSSTKYPWLWGALLWMEACTGCSICRLVCPQ